MAVTAATNTGTTSTTSTTTATKGLADKFDQFLLLLTTQLKNQSPLDPMDVNQFTQQLVQYSQVEQQIKGNDYLSQLLSTQERNQTSNLASYIGTEVTSDGKIAAFDGIRTAEWTVTAAAPAQATMTILDANGNVVQTGALTLAQGPQAINWDGTTSAGSKAPAGRYTLQIDAKDTSGTTVTTTTAITALIDGVDLSNPQAPVLKSGTVSIPLDQVTGIRKPAS